MGVSATRSGRGGRRIRPARPHGRARPALALALAAVPAAFPVSAQQPFESSDHVGVRLRSHVFDDDTDAWQELALSYAREDARGTGIVRITGARRFDVEGVQGELDLYPTFPGDAGYGYLNVGYSPDVVFPEWRLGAEGYLAVGDAWEVSAGARWLDFREVAVTLWTGSLARYVGAYWISLRPTWKDGSGSSGDGLSGLLWIRRYGGGRFDWMGVRIGAGESAARFETTTDVARTNAFSAGVEGRHPVGAVWVVEWSVGWEWEELTAERERQALVLALGVDRFF